MKKISTSVSPFIMLIIPVILFLGLSLALKEDNKQEEFVAGNKNQTGVMIKASAGSLITLLIKK